MLEADWQFRHWSTYTAPAWILLGVIALHLVGLLWFSIRWLNRRRLFANAKWRNSLRK